MTTPQITSAVLIDDNTVEVNFDQDVTWDAVNDGTFTVAGLVGSWIAQDTTSALVWLTSVAHSVVPAAPFAWSAPDASLTPVPDSTQTGFVS